MMKPLALTLLLAGCDTLTVPLVTGPPAGEVATTELASLLAQASLCADGHGEMGNAGFEAPEHRGLTFMAMTASLPGWRIAGDAQVVQARGNPRDRFWPTAPAEVQYASVPVGAALQNTMNVRPGEAYVLLLAHRRAPEGVGAVVIALRGASSPDQPGTGVVTMTHEGTDAWQWLPIPFTSDAAAIELSLARTEAPAGRILDHRRHEHYVDLAGIWRLCPATGGGEAAPSDPVETAPADETTAGDVQ